MKKLFVAAVLASCISSGFAEDQLHAHCPDPETLAGTPYHHYAEYGLVHLIIKGETLTCIYANHGHRLDRFEAVIKAREIRPVHAARDWIRTGNNEYSANEGDRAFPFNRYLVDLIHIEPVAGMAQWPDNAYVNWHIKIGF